MKRRRYHPEILWRFRAKSALIVTGLVLASPFACGLTSLELFAVTSNPDSAPEENPRGADETGRGEALGIPCDFKGFAELRTLVHAITEQEAPDAVKKRELRLNFDVKYGPDDLYLRATGNVYGNAGLAADSLDAEYAFAENARVRRNLAVSDRSAEASFRELYVNKSFGNIRLRAGNQIYGWGTADVFNPTSYFNPFDLREALFRADDELKAGVPSLSGMFFIGDATLEVVVVPVHIPMLLAPVGNFWEIRYREGPFPVSIEEPGGLPATFANAAAGARYAASVAGVDFAASVYRGPDREPVFRPMRTLIAPNEPVTILVRPEYHSVTMAGVDFSLNFDRVVVQAEAVYSPDKAGVVGQVYTPQVRFPFEVRTGHFVSYSAGFNYFIPLGLLLEGHEGETVLTVEWNQSRYFDDGIMPPLITDVLAVRLQDEFLGGRMKTTFTLLWDAHTGAMVLWPSLGWDFLNGLSVEIAYVSISARSGTERSIFSFYNDNDIITARVRYAL
ncbi:MAG TPA: DUF1302 family protein [Spirochaetota bacterium]|nr:DUF1302 family protein [Spirochaetota bacterium]